MWCYSKMDWNVTVVQKLEDSEANMNLSLYNITYYEKSEFILQVGALLSVISAVIPAQSRQ